MAFVNGKMGGLLGLCSPQAYVIVLGPSTPLSPLLFVHGIDMHCGSIVDSIDPMLDSIITGDSFRQIKHNQHFWKFILRWLEKTKTEWRFFCLSTTSKMVVY